MTDAKCYQQDVASNDDVGYSDPIDMEKAVIMNTQSVI